MKRIADWIRAIIVSPEALVVLILLATRLGFPEELAELGRRISSNAEGVRYLAFIPASMLSLIVVSRSKLLFPEGKLAQEFQEWPNYRLVSDRYHISLLLEVACVIASFAIWILGMEIEEPRVLLVFFGAILVSLTTYVHFWFALYSVRRILDESKHAGDSFAIK